jgi:predicted RNA binding protein YcfA (HicA-like mRNA interferase family)
MPPLKPVTRRDLVRKLRRLGFSGPFPGGKHLYMNRGDRDVVIPNPHGSDIGMQLLARILEQAGVSRDEWDLA